MRENNLRRRDRRAGFTLFEVLVAMALTGMILAFLATMTAHWLPNWDRDIARVQRDEQLALGLERVVADLAAAEFIPAGRDTRQVLFIGRARSVIFVRTVLAPHAAPGLEVVRVTEGYDEHGPALVRTRAPFMPTVGEATSQNQPGFADPVVLIRSPYQLSFAYAGPDRVWRESWERASQLPRTIKITVSDSRTGRTLAASTTVRVHAELPMECITAKVANDCPPSSAQTPQAVEGEALRGPNAGKR